MNIFYGQCSMQANPKSLERNIEIALLPTCSALSLNAKPGAEDSSLPSERTAGMGRDPSPWKLPAIPGSPEGKRSSKFGPAAWPGRRAKENFPLQCLAGQSPAHRQGKLCLMTFTLPWKNAFFWSEECFGGFYRVRNYRGELTHLESGLGNNLKTPTKKHKCRLFLLYGQFPTMKR